MWLIYLFEVCYQSVKHSIFQHLFSSLCCAVCAYMRGICNQVQQKNSIIHYVLGAATDTSTANFTVILVHKLREIAFLEECLPAVQIMLTEYCS